MFHAVLLTNPENPTLNLDPIEALRNAWGGGAIRWLSVNEAAEFSIPARPSNFETVWRELQDLGIDLAIIPSGDRRKSVLIADMDSTMIQQECIDELARSAGVYDDCVEITRISMDGGMGFEDALRARVGMLRGLPETALHDVYENQITLTAGGETLLATMTAMGAHSALVSGGFTFFTDKIAARLGFKEHRANILPVAKGMVTGETVDPILGRDAKVTALHDITSRLGMGPGDVLAVGDGANDLGMLGLAGMGVALHAKPSVQAACDIRINHGDLTALLYLQGFEKSEFVTG